MKFPATTIPLGLERIPPDIVDVVALVAEALRAASNAGIDPRLIPDALSGGWADSSVLQLHGRRMAEAMQDPPSGEGPSGGVKSHTSRPMMMLKDMDIASDLSHITGTPMPVTTLVAELYRMVVAQGYSGEGQIGLMNLLHR